MTTLWALVALAVLAAYIDGVVASDIERAVEAKRSLRAELERRDTEATLIYLLVTGRMNHTARRDRRADAPHPVRRRTSESNFLRPRSSIRSAESGA